MITISEALKNDRQFRSLTGLALPELEKLSAEFTSGLKKGLPKKHKKRQKLRKRKPGGGRKSAWGSPANQLFFIRFYLKNYRN